MAWDIRDADTKKLITENVAPPSGVTELFSDDMWAGIYSMWATDVGFSAGYQDAGSLYELWKDFRYNSGYEAIRDKYVVDGNAYRIEWPTSVKDRFDRADAGMDDQAATLNELWNTATEKLNPYLDAFFADIKEIQSSAASEPKVKQLTRDQFDQGLVDRVNGANVKALNEGEKVEGWLRGDFLVLGDGHPESYLRYAQDGGIKVRLYVWEKGGAFGRGELRWASLADRPVPWDETQGIEAAVARFSQKKLKHT